MGKLLSDIPTNMYVVSTKTALMSSLQLLTFFSRTLCLDPSFDSRLTKMEF